MDILLNAKLVQTHQLGSYRYFVSSVQPHKSASLVIMLLDTSRNEVQRIHKVIEGEEYAGWGSDDTYLDELVDKEVKKVVIGMEPNGSPTTPPFSIITDEDVVLENVFIPTDLSSNIIDE